MDSEAVQTSDESFLVVGGCHYSGGYCTDDVNEFNGNGGFTHIDDMPFARGAFGVTFTSYNRIVCQ